MEPQCGSRAACLGLCPASLKTPHCGVFRALGPEQARRRVFESPRAMNYLSTYPRIATACRMLPRSTNRWKTEWK